VASALTVRTASWRTRTAPNAAAHSSTIVAPSPTDTSRISPGVVLALARSQAAARAGRLRAASVAALPFPDPAAPGGVAVDVGAAGAGADTAVARLTAGDHRSVRTDRFEA
jgi:hypothetical protein